jgi:hypothetical protein
MEELEGMYTPEELHRLKVSMMIKRIRDTRDLSSSSHTGTPVESDKFTSEEISQMIKEIGIKPKEPLFDKKLLLEKAKSAYPTVVNVCNAVALLIAVLSIYGVSRDSVVFVFLTVILVIVLSTKLFIGTQILSDHHKQYKH